MSNKPLLHTSQLSIGYARRGQPDYPVLLDLDLRIEPGQVVCVLGPNGSGKSTLIRTLAGLQPALTGQVQISGEPVDSRYPKRIARLLSVVLTDRIEVSNLTVFELVSMGRYPYSRWYGRTDEVDADLIHQALSQVHLESFGARNVQELSDGELQRAMIAKALAQDTRVILLDEPTAHLDMPNRIQMMQLLRKLAKETGKAVLLSSHDHELALQSADILWLIKRLEPVRAGLPEDLVLNGSFEDTFHSKGVRFDPESGSYRISHPTQFSCRLIGNSLAGFWTRRALEREGILADPEADSRVCVHILEDEPRWGIGPAEAPEHRFSTIAALIAHIRSESFIFAPKDLRNGFE